MDLSPTPGQTICLLIEITRAPDGRLEGRIRTDGTDGTGATGATRGTGAWSSFSGVLELLKVLEDHV
jgi:hypothetical protein